MDEDIFETDLKKSINNIVWMYAPPHITLNQAEEIACYMFDCVRKGELIVPVQVIKEEEDNGLSQ